MNGPDHYREAERDIEIANDSSIADGTADFFLRRAQTHAMLADTAARAVAANWDDWRVVAS
jgi:hypothetical protein